MHAMHRSVLGPCYLLKIVLIESVKHASVCARPCYLLKIVLIESVIKTTGISKLITKTSWKHTQYISCDVFVMLRSYVLFRRSILMYCVSSVF